MKSYTFLQQRNELNRDREISLLQEQGLKFNDFHFLKKKDNYAPLLSWFSMQNNFDTGMSCESLSNMILGIMNDLFVEKME